MSTLLHALERLQALLEEERDALIRLDGEALSRFAQDKVGLLEALSAEQPAISADPNLQARLAELAELHIANGALLQRRRQETSWLLQTLGAASPATAYDPLGTRDMQRISRSLAQA
ncbi:MAG: flagellar protein FlgN [Aquimonas sp.]|nr:flagellar protein FlgN [Aquimonas sp.]